MIVFLASAEMEAVGRVLSRDGKEWRNVRKLLGPSEHLFSSFTLSLSFTFSEMVYEKPLSCSR